MIISASRRTDIPAFYGRWLLNRLREGHALVRNPFHFQQVRRVSLDPRQVDCLVFWTKNPAPLLPYLPEIERLGHRFYFHYTLTACNRDLEPLLPPREERIAAFCALAEQIGPHRVLWRFDPIVFTGRQGSQAVLGEFAALAARLRRHTRQCIVSFVTLYAKCRRNLAGQDLSAVDDGEKMAFVGNLVEIAASHGIELHACCDSFFNGPGGIGTARCIDDRLVSTISGQTVQISKDKGQRPGCGCAASVDIGAYDTCPHGCRYCYANAGERAVAANWAAHDPRSPILSGALTGQERIIEWTDAPLRPRQYALPMGGSLQSGSVCPSSGWGRSNGQGLDSADD
ncbi:MAG: DUF1848 domain-containing protein [Desulfobulbus sp.]|nr:DUF1848 domain-containing protein [Desulfobulbus sp.]